MKKKIISLVILVCLVCVGSISFAETSGIDIIRQGLLGAGSGAIGGAVSGGKSEDLWIGALTGAGVNIIGGSLLDMITTGGSSRSNRTTTSTHYASAPVQYVPVNGRRIRKNPNSNIRKKYMVTSAPKVYSSEYREGYKDGYLQGYKDAIKELMGK